jgi:hypothetical protein
MSMTHGRKTTIAVIVLLWLATTAWLVFYEAFPGLLAGTTGGYHSLLSQGVMVMDQWMSITFQGKAIGYSHTSVSAGDAGSARQYQIENTTVLNLNVMGSRQRIAVKSQSAVDSSYRMQTFAFVLSSTGYSIDVKGRRLQGESYEVTVRSASSTRRLTLVIPDDAVLYSPMTEMALKALEPGKQVTLRVFNPVSLSAQNITIRALRRETITHRSKTVEATVLTALVEGMETLSWIDSNGSILRQETLFGWTMEACDAREALAGTASGDSLNADMLTSLAVPVSGPVDRLPSARSATLRLDGAVLLRENLESPRQSVLSITGTVAEIRVQAGTFPETNAIPGARTPPPTNLAPWLAASPFVQSDDPRMIAKAREITEGSTDPRQAVLALYQWVNTKVAKIPTVSLPSALDVLLRPEGDCNEHTYLFVGLARAAGIPAKIRVGLTLHNGLFYYHAWPSVYLGDWVDMDPTLGQPAVGADHISLFEGELAEQMKLMGVLGRLRITLTQTED